MAALTAVVAVLDFIAGDLVQAVVCTSLVGVWLAGPRLWLRSNTDGPDGHFRLKRCAALLVTPMLFGVLTTAEAAKRLNFGLALAIGFGFSLVMWGPLAAAGMVVSRRDH
jgi:hypothetical protein